MNKFLLLFSLILLLSCGNEAEPTPRSRDDIFRDQVNSPSLFMTKSGAQMKAPGDRRCFVDQASGKLFWMVLECKNPKCPAIVESGKPNIFIIPDPGVFVSKSGKLDFDPEKEEKAKRKGGFFGCKKCIPLRQKQMLQSGLGAETNADIERYESYVVPHVLPETKKRLAELEAEMVTRVNWEKEQAGED
jgi:hypothetical protein